MKHSSNGKVTVKDELITPERAAKLLLEVKNVRTARQDHVHCLALAMKSGIWELNGDTIKLDHDGAVIDGEHRLRACIEAERPFRTLMAYGIKESATIDTGSRHRSIVQLIAHEGMKYASVVSVIARTALLVEDTDSLERLNVSGLKNNLTVQRVKAYVDKHKSALEEAAARAFPAAAAIRLSTGGLGYLAYVAASNPKLDTFLESLRTGEGLRKGNPAYALRERALKRGRARVPTPDAFALIFKAWNAYVRNEPMQQLKWIGIKEQIPLPLA